MELERLTAQVRPRNPWEAMDLGFHLARRYWKPLYLPWLLVLLPAGGGLFYLLQDWPRLALLSLWLLKPAFDPIPLRVLSRALFGAVPEWRQTLSATPGLLWNGLARGLIRRLSPTRSFLLPVRQLEQLSGNRARERTRVLLAGDRGHAVGLTLLFLILELAVLSSLLWLIPLFVPAELEADLGEFLIISGFQAGWLFWIFACGYLLTIALLEPLYVACGFALYLNRRTLLEAWDVELSFRRLNRRLTRSASALCLIGAVVFLAAWLLPSPVFAEPFQVPAPQPVERSKAVIQEVLDAPEFDIWEKVPVWRYLGDRDNDDDRQIPNLGIGGMLAGFFEWLLWAALAVGVAWLVIYRDRWLPALLRRTSKKQPAPAPATLFGMDIRPDALPPDIAASARDLSNRGETRKALSLLYRGALAGLVHHQGIGLADSTTESECLAALRPRISKDLYHHMQRLTDAWHQVAYAHRPPPGSEINLLADEWQAFFGNPE